MTCQRHKSRPEKMVTVVDKFDEEAIRRLIHNFHATEKQLATLITSIPLVHENLVSRETKYLRLLLKEQGFRYLKRCLRTKSA